MRKERGYENYDKTDIFDAGNSGGCSGRSGSGGAVLNETDTRATPKNKEEKMVLKQRLWRHFVVLGLAAGLGAG